MKNILIITGWLDVSGTETFIMNVLRSINHNKFHVDFLLTNRKDTAYSREAESMGCKLIYIPSRRSGIIRYISSLKLFFKEHAQNYDVIHYCGGSLTSIAPLYFATKYKIPIRIAHAHSTSNDGIHNYILHRINKLLGQGCITHRWGCSKEACKYFFGNRDSTIVKNGVDLSRFKFDYSVRNETRKKLGIDPEDIVLGHIGRFVKLKRQDFVVDVFNSLHEKHQNSKLILVGVGPEMQRVKEKVHKMGLDEFVIFTGERSDIPELLFSMDCLMMPSEYEGLPFVLVEAQASDLYCVVSNTVSRDCKISDAVTFVDIKESADIWAHYIDNVISKVNPRNYHIAVAENGYDIHATVQYIEDAYLGKL